MAIDTRNKRASAIEVGLFWRDLLPAPSGAVDAAGRAQVTGFYPFVSAGISVFLTGLSFTAFLGVLDVVASGWVPVPDGPGGAWVPVLATYVYLVDADGVYLVDSDGNYLVSANGGTGSWTAVPPPGATLWVPVTT